MAGFVPSIFIESAVLFYDGTIEDQVKVQVIYRLARAAGGVDSGEIKIDWLASDLEVDRNDAIKNAIVTHINLQQSQETFSAADIFCGVSLTQAP